MHVGGGGGVKIIFDKERKPPFPPRNRKKCVSGINPETLKTSIDIFFKKKKKSKAFMPRSYIHWFTSLYTRTLKEILGHIGVT